MLDVRAPGGAQLYAQLYAEYYICTILLVTAVGSPASPHSDPSRCACPVASAASFGCVRCCCCRPLWLSASVLGFAPEVMPPYWAVPLSFVCALSLRSSLARSGT